VGAAHIMGEPGTDDEDRLQAEGEAAFARLILDGDDLEHAAGHVGGAVGNDPALPEGYEALARLAARAGGPQAALALFPEQRRYAGALACRAALLAAAGRESDAVVLLSEVINAVPARAWASVAWLARPGLAEALDPGALATSLANVTQGIGDPADQAERTAIEPYYTLVKQAVAVHPDDLHLATMASSLARRMDDLDTAIAWASAARDFRFEPTGDALGVVMLGSALRRAGRPEETIELWRATCRADPSQSYLAVDLAETLAAQNRPQEGITVLEQVLQREPEHEKAAPAIHALRYQIAPDARHLLALHEHLQRHPDHDYAAYLLHSRCHGRAWLGRPDQATEAVTNAMHMALERFGPGYPSPVRVELSGIEPPSAGLAARLALPALEITAAQAGTPDPRHATREVHTRVWRYEGTTPLPAVPPASQHALALACELATPQWASPAALHARAAPLGELPVADLLGLLVHPPAPDRAPWTNGYAAKAPDVWLRAVQALACTGIAHHRTDQPWADSERRAVLLDLLDGVEDWVCEAAAMALVATGWACPPTRAEVAEQLVARLDRAVDAATTRPVTILQSLCRLTLACAWLEPDVVTSLRTLLAQAAEDEH
jgi:tetratricopeptide (TPR) repeat protein